MSSNKRIRISPTERRSDPFDSLPDDLEVSILSKLPSSSEFVGSLSVNKRIRISPIERRSDPFDSLPDDLVVCILSKLCSSSSSPSEFVGSLSVCKRFNRVGLSSMVLARASSRIFSIRAKNWSDSAHRFVKRCVNAGSVEACYFLGMIRFYCLGNRGIGASLMAKAAIRSHAAALYSLAVIQFNGSGGAKSDKDLRAGVALCSRAAFLGHIDALRELGHCLQDGYGVRRNVADGRRLLVQANAKELSATLASHQPLTWTTCDHHMAKPGSGSGLECALLSDFGCNVPMPEPHPANRFLMEWFELKGGLPDPELRMCSHSGCGRPETRSHEFRRCSVCAAVNYCSRGCQAHDWKLRHKSQCKPAELWENAGGAAEDAVAQS